MIFSVLIEEGAPRPRHSLLESSTVAMTPFEGVVSLPPIECRPDSRMTQCCEALFYCYIWSWRTVCRARRAEFPHPSPPGTPHRGVGIGWL
ncbi:hypothetical protein HMPREF1549_02439 [Actinomyces johnsonii F0510]|uniref:Uncharacterized protein n=1 Tax=Actinomyces johnsonii F0510 TaxID=1227262 RepID=U1PKU9_9ACTO|nr:hypothetical protein HMPREF1549_02439 [Actinomyces johnsonii F0510]